jgi:tripartite-type tricarboxylate transporter receptor subunit TctC
MLAAGVVLLFCRFSRCWANVWPYVEHQTMPRIILGSLVGLLALGMSGLALAAEPNTNDIDYPERLITVLVPYAPGGSTDVVTRIITDQMSITLRRNFLIQNVVGADGTTAVLRAKQAPPDGYTLLTGNMGPLATAPALNPQLEYDPRTSFQPIGVFAQTPILILGRPDFPPKDLKEFILYVKANAHKLDEGHAGFGSFPYAACLLFDQILGVRPRLVPHDGGAPALAALADGRLDYMCDPITDSIPRVHAGFVKAYAIAASQRSPALPEVPTTAEGGLPEYQVSNSQALFAPKELPGAIVHKLNDALVKALDDETVRQRLLDLGTSIPERDQRTPQALADLLNVQLKRWKSLIEATRSH